MGNLFKERVLFTRLPCDTKTQKAMCISEFYYTLSGELSKRFLFVNCGL